MHTEETIRLRGRNYAAAIDGCKGTTEAVDFYADALRTYGPDGVDWRQVNGACLRRWQPSTVDRIKRRAWKRVRSMDAAKKEGGA